MIGAIRQAVCACGTAQASTGDSYIVERRSAGHRAHFTPSASRSNVRPPDLGGEWDETTLSIRRSFGEGVSQSEIGAWVGELGGVQMSQEVLDGSV